MKTLDKILLASLILLLPIGLFLSQWLLNDAPEEETEGVPVVDVSKLESLISQAVNSAQVTNKSNQPEFIISVVNYATESATLTLAGKAPSPSSAVIVTPAFILPNPSPSFEELSSSKSASPSPKNSAQKLDVFSVIPSETAAFTYEYTVPTEYLEAIIEIRLDQNQSTQTIRFDLGKKKQVF